MKQYIAYKIPPLILVIMPLLALALTPIKAQAYSLSSEQKSEITSLQQALNNRESIVAQFRQTNTNGSYSSGTFYLKKPGKIRWQYDPPTPIVIVSNGPQITYYDYELEQISYVSLDGALASILSEKNINFLSEELEILEAGFDKEESHITIMQKDRPEEGKVTFVFKREGAVLKDMIVENAAKQVTHIMLTDHHYNVALQDHLFIIKNPKHNKAYPGR